MSPSQRPPLVVTAGMGIGPEVTLRALADGPWHDVVVVGRRTALDRENQQLGLPLVAVDTLRPAAGAIAVLDPGDAPEPTEVAAIRRGAEACLAGQAAALVTAPIHKKRLQERGFAFTGHTDFLGHLCGVEGEVMAFVGGRFRLALVTTHVPLMAVGPALSPARIVHTTRTFAAALEHDRGIARPRVAVCGLNPHAGEEGMLGTEERDTIGPATEQLRAEGLAVVGPISAETAFMQMARGALDGIVAMYHDQGLVPLKAVDFGRSVNWTLGLPLVRTSVDHGTADELVGTGRADPASMGAALALARGIVARRAAQQHR